MPLVWPKSGAIPRPMVWRPNFPSHGALLVPMRVGNGASEHALVLVCPIVVDRLRKKPPDRTSEGGGNDFPVLCSRLAGRFPEVVVRIPGQELSHRRRGEVIYVDDVGVRRQPPEGGQA